MKSIWNVEVSERRVRIARSGFGRLANGLERFLVGLPIASAALFVFFMFDLLGPRAFDMERTLGYVASAVGLGVVFALAWGVAGTMRHEEWEIDFSNSLIRYETRLSMGQPQGVEVDTSNLTGVRVRRAGVLRESRVELVFTESVEVAVKTRLGASHIDEAATALKALAERESISFDVD